MTELTLVSSYNALPGGLLNPAKKGSVGFKIAAFMGTGFSLPFLVAKCVDSIPRLEC